MNTIPQTVTSEHIRSLTLSVGLLDRLLPRSRGKRYSRIEAYRYLLSILTDQALGEQTLLGVALDIKSGQVIITDSELSQIWGWHRATVKSFLFELEELAVLTMRRETKFSILTFPAVQKKVAVKSEQETSTDDQQETADDANLPEKVSQPVSVSDFQKPKPSTSVKTGNSKTSSGSVSKAPSSQFQAPSLFDEDDCTITTDETHDESEATNPEMGSTSSTDEAAVQNTAPVAVSQTMFPLALAVQKSSVSDGAPLSHATEEKTVVKSEDGNLTDDNPTSNYDPSDEA